MAGQAGRSAAPPADPWTCDARRCQRAGTVQVPSVRPQNDADAIANTASHLPCAASGRARLENRHASPTTRNLSRRGPSACRLPVGYRALVAASRAVWTTVSNGGPLELVATTTGIVPARMPKKI
jgi:hypothetical protein